MDLEELDKLEQGKKLLGKISTAKKQIEAAKACTCVKLFRPAGFSPADPEDRKRIDIDFSADHPFYPEAKKFIDYYVSYLECRIVIWETEFKEL